MFLKRYHALRFLIESVQIHLLQCGDEVVHRREETMRWSAAPLRDFFTPRNIAKNVAIIGIGAYAMVKYDEYFANNTPRLVSKLVKDAAAEFERDPASARSKLKEANVLLQSYVVSTKNDNKTTTAAPPSWTSNLFRLPGRGYELGGKDANSLLASRFTIHFFMGLSYELSNSTSNAPANKLALECYRRAVSEVRNVEDFTVFGNVTRKRMGIAFDRVAQQYHDEGKLAKALECYSRALEALGEPEESRESLALRGVVEEVAGVLNNMSTMMIEIGNEDVGESIAKRSRELMVGR